MIAWTLWLQDWGDKHAEVAAARSIINAQFVLDSGTLVLELGISERNSESQGFERQICLEPEDLRALKAMCEVALQTLNNEDG